MSLELTQAAKALLAERGFDPVLGARPLRRTVQREIEDVLAEKMLFGEVGPGQIVLVDVEGEGPDRDLHLQGPEELGGARPAAVRDRRRAEAADATGDRAGRLRRVPTDVPKSDAPDGPSVTDHPGSAQRPRGDLRQRARRRPARPGTARAARPPARRPRSARR